MSFIKRLGRKIISLRAPKDILRRELFYLRRKRKKVEKMIKRLNNYINIGKNIKYCQYHLYLNQEK